MKNAKFATAKIISTHYYRGSKIVHFEFIYKGKTFKNRAKLNFNKANRFVEKDAEIKIAVDPNHPTRSYIYDLYFDD